MALLLAAISYRYPLAEEVLRPFMVFCKAVPVAVFAVLLLIWWGSSMLAVAICFLVVFPNIYLNTLEGLKSADRGLLEMAEVFRLPLGTQFFYIYRPALKMCIRDREYERDGVKGTTTLTPKYDESEGRYLIGISNADFVELSGLDSFRYSWYEMRYCVNMTWKSLAMLVQGQVSRQDVAGPVGIAVNVVGKTCLLYTSRCV